MTCREFKHEATSRNLAELAQTNESAVLGHAETCRSCGAWLEKQRALAASLHTLRAKTASLEAGENVERALLDVFRQGIPANVVASPAIEKPASGLKLVSSGMTKHGFEAASSSARLSWRLSRLFEIGAYAAVAAAIAVAMFLGARLLHQPSTTAQVQNPSTSEQAAPVAPQIATSAATMQQPPVARRPATSHRQQRVEPPEHSPAVAAHNLADEAQSYADAGYTPLMFCDPLSCSSETQVVRMELPGVHEAQPQTADVVVGFDGMVRAVRFVN